MHLITSEPAAWEAAGGDLARMALLARVGKVRGFTDGDSRCLAGIHPDRPEVGTVGDWVGGTDVLRAAEAWLRQEGCASAEGPALLAPWFPAGAVVGPFEVPPMLGEPTDRAERWTEAGWTPSARWASIVAPHQPQLAAAMDKAAALSSRGWRLQSPETGPSSQVTEQAWDRAVAHLHELAVAAFGRLPGYLPVPADVVAEAYRPIRPLADPRLTLFALDPAGRPAGFLLGLPAHPGSDRPHRWFQIATLGVRPDASHSGVATWLVAAAHQAARKAGYTAGVHTRIPAEGGQPADRAWTRGELVRVHASFRLGL